MGLVEAEYLGRGIADLTVTASVLVVPADFPEAECLGGGQI